MGVLKTTGKNAAYEIIIAVDEETIHHYLISEEIIFLLDQVQQHHYSKI